MTAVFLCYRHADSPEICKAVFDRLNDRFGASNVFMDVETLRPGDRWLREIRQHVRRCQALMVMIGPDWRPEALSQVNDYVRQEIELALKLGKRIVPFLVGHAPPAIVNRLPGLASRLGSFHMAQVGGLADADFEQRLASIVGKVEEAMDATVRLRIIPMSKLGKLSWKALHGLKRRRGEAPASLFKLTVNEKPQDATFDRSMISFKIKPCKAQISLSVVGGPRTRIDLEATNGQRILLGFNSTNHMEQRLVQLKFGTWYLMKWMMRRR